MKIEIKIINDKKIYYYDNEWQKPVITEYQIFKLFFDSVNIPCDYFAFPWATMIDNYETKSNNKLLKFIRKYKIYSLYCFTIIQHINYEKYLSIIKSIGITHIFTPHKNTLSYKLEKKYNIKILAFSLFPAQNNLNHEITNITNRKYLMSFIGQYDNGCYLTDIREKIFNIFTNYINCFIKRRQKWHYLDIVYNNQNTNIDDEKEYIQNMLETKFSLCPSGSGPNSIRIWESMSYGTIPIILADTLILPEIKNINWNDYFILWKESEIDKLLDYINNISNEKMIMMSNNCLKLYLEYFCPNNMNKIILEYFENQ